MRIALGAYRVMATVVGVLLIVLVLIGLPLHYLSPDGSQAEAVGDGISRYLGVGHGWLYMIFLVAAFVLSRKAGWDLRFTILTLVSGTIPILSFWAERRATRRVQADFTDALVSRRAPSSPSSTTADPGPSSTGTRQSSTRAR